MRSKSGRAAMVLLATAALGLAACSSGGSSAGTDPATSGSGSKPLSLSSIAIASGSRSDSALVYIAQAAGFFKREGLTVKVVDVAQVSNTADVIAAFYGGTYNVLNNGASTTILGAQSSGSQSISAVMQMDVGTTQEIALTNAKAKQLNLPTGSSPATALKQFLALKGSHIQLAVTAMSSISALDVLAACKTQGLTCAANSSSADIDLVTTGTPVAQVAGLEAGKYDAIAAGPPTTRVPDTTDIELGEIAPVSDSVNDYVVVSPSMVKQHPDTVQAMVNAIGMAWKLYQTDPAAAEKDAGQMYKDAGVTDATEAHDLFTGWAKYWTNPVPTEQAYNDTVKVINLSQATKVTLPYTQFADPTFAKKMVQELGLKTS
jgi:ABC-type nitrate/sulfonate/bicarbonate transport system substrate-binding protein